MLTIAGDLGNQCLRLDDPSYKYAGSDSDYRHQDVIADVVEDIKNLRCDTIWQSCFEVENIVPQANDDAENHSSNTLESNGLISAPAKPVYTSGDNSFHYGDRAGKSGKEYHQEEDCPDHSTDRSHFRKNLRQCDEHESRTGILHSFHSEESENGRYDHYACEECDKSVEELDLVDRFDKIAVTFEV